MWPMASHTGSTDGDFIFYAFIANVIGGHRQVLDAAAGIHEGPEPQGPVTEKTLDFFMGEFWLKKNFGSF